MISLCRTVWQHDRCLIWMLVRFVWRVQPACTEIGGFHSPYRSGHSWPGLYPSRRRSPSFRNGSDKKCQELAGFRLKVGATNFIGRAAPLIPGMLHYTAFVMRGTTGRYPYTPLLGSYDLRSSPVTTRLSALMTPAFPVSFIVFRHAREEQAGTPAAFTLAGRKAEYTSRRS